MEWVLGGLLIFVYFWAGCNVANFYESCFNEKLAFWQEVVVIITWLPVSIYVTYTKER